MMESKPYMDIPLLTGNDEICAEGTSTHIIVKKDNFRPHPLKRHFLNGF